MDQHSPPEATFRDYLLFGLILLAIATAATLLSNGESWFEWMRWFEGLFFLTFATFKLMRYRDFIDAYRGYDLIAKRSVWYARAYPFIELLLAVGFLTSTALPLVLTVTLVLMGIGSVGVIKELRRGSHITCACLGTVIKLPLTKVTLFEDMLMGGMAAYMLAELFLT